MRTTIILTLVLILTLGGAARAQTYSSKSAFSKASRSIDNSSDASDTVQGRLARITAYWPGEDYYTNHKRSATGARLRDGFCAVDSRIIPYGSLVTISGVGSYLAMDTGTAVISRKAAKESGHNKLERSAPGHRSLFRQPQGRRAFQPRRPQVCDGGLGPARAGVGEQLIYSLAFRFASSSSQRA